jgi:hypothetical protein
MIHRRRPGNLGLTCVLAWSIASALNLGAQQPKFNAEQILKKQPSSNNEPSAVSDKPPTPDGLAFFEKHIRPVLVKECYACHSPEAETIKGGLKLDTREGIRKGGATGPAVVPGDAPRSLIIKALKQSTKELAMPPKKKLDEATIANFEKWVALGAPDPRDGVTPRVAKNEIDIEKGRKFWAFQPVKKPAAPTSKDARWAKSDIDRFLLAELEAKGLRPVADADANALLRRVTYDLTGLPPSAEEIERFVKEFAATPQASFEKVVDQLLASPRFGERWGRHWLDVARFAESSGRSTNFAYPHAWRYRDYVIAAFNADKPFDQFIREQLSGDLLPAKDDAQKAEFLIATGFLALGPKSHAERSRLQFQMDLADEQIDATFQAFQGITVACARCHDHKFDPIPQKDYYALSGIFTSSETCYGTIRIFQNNHASALVGLPKGANAPNPLQPLTADRRASIETEIKGLREQIAKATGPDAFLMTIFQRTRSANLESELANFEVDGAPKALAMGVRELAAGAADGRAYVRGELDQPGERVRRGFPQAMTKQQPAIARGSGRKELAEWIGSKENPLTARVMANRVWKHLIGRGLVATVDNFGASGQAPSHPDLLDHLAATFVDNGWSVKKLIRSIVLSRAYRLSPQFNEKNFDVDPDNTLVWRLPRRRLEAEAIRDTMLALSGRLDLTRPVGDSVARFGEGNIGFALRGRGPGDDAAARDAHRSVYLPIVRDLTPDVLTLFDFPDASLIVGERSTTTIPAQSLFLLNNAFVIRAAEELADKLLAGGDDDRERIARLYQRCCSRAPTATEASAALNFIAEYGKEQTRRSTWAALTQALFVSAEFLQR